MPARQQEFSDRMSMTAAVKLARRQGREEARRIHMEYFLSFLFFSFLFFFRRTVEGEDRGKIAKSCRQDDQ